MSLGTDWKVELSDQFIEELQQQFGETGIQFMYDRFLTNIPTRTGQNRAA